MSTVDAVGEPAISDIPAASRTRYRTVSTMAGPLRQTAEPRREPAHHHLQAIPGSLDGISRTPSPQYLELQNLGWRNIDSNGPDPIIPLFRPSESNMPHDSLVKINDIPVIVFALMVCIWKAPYPSIIKSDFLFRLSTCLLSLGPLISVAGLAAYAFTLPTPPRYHNFGRRPLHWPNGQRATTFNMYWRVIIPFVLISSALVGFTLSRHQGIGMRRRIDPADSVSMKGFSRNTDWATWEAGSNTETDVPHSTAPSISLSMRKEAARAGARRIQSRHPKESNAKRSITPPLVFQMMTREGRGTARMFCVDNEIWNAKKRIQESKKNTDRLFWAVMEQTSLMPHPKKKKRAAPVIDLNIARTPYTSYSR
ncbi:hypothetical protein SISNIDRAFT_495923 [Sistotremastrum niveocremeum HHB9708]|uniref:Uncharacterized protein n=1 Tax=Sistotremastrum niveocremeum HHB9708 TaxID=1314777 RepID=A0A164TXQ4_9AGAM|nr:hypothetical protein SISNIDRAFT_495923 [Sistotremastrum niveocremeum HHB9708]